MYIYTSYARASTLSVTFTRKRIKMCSRFRHIDITAWVWQLLCIKTPACVRRQEKNNFTGDSTQQRVSLRDVVHSGKRKEERIIEQSKAASIIIVAARSSLRSGVEGQLRRGFKDCKISCICCTQLQYTPYKTIGQLCTTRAKSTKKYETLFLGLSCIMETSIIFEERANRGVLNDCQISAYKLNFEADR